MKYVNEGAQRRKPIVIKMINDADDYDDDNDDADSDNIKVKTHDAPLAK